MGTALFNLGQVVATRAVSVALNQLEIASLIKRHAAGDYGDLCDEDTKENEAAIKHGNGRVFSSYNTTHGKVWVITECDRSYTTVLFPSDF